VEAIRDEPAVASDLGEAARLLRVILAEMPPATPRERATARRIEGAAVALNASGRRPEQDRFSRSAWGDQSRP
jgi:hypothetical protein